MKRSLYFSAATRPKALERMHECDDKNLSFVAVCPLSDATVCVGTWCENHTWKVECICISVCSTKPTNCTKIMYTRHCDFNLSPLSSSSLPLLRQSALLLLLLIVPPTLIDFNIRLDYENNDKLVLHTTQSWFTSWLHVVGHARVYVCV